MMMMMMMTFKGNDRDIVVMKSIVTPVGRTCVGGGRVQGALLPARAHSGVHVFILNFKTRVSRTNRTGAGLSVQPWTRFLSRCFSASCRFVGPGWCSCARRWQWLVPAGVRRSRRMFRTESAAPDAPPGASLCTWLSSPQPSDTSRYLQRPRCLRNKTSHKMKKEGQPWSSVHSFDT